MIALGRDAGRVTAALPKVPNLLKAIPYDLAAPHKGEEKLRSLLENIGIDGLLHCAATWSGTRFDEETIDSFTAIIKTNVIGTFALVQLTSGLMKLAQEGSIVLLTSTAVNTGGVLGGAAYVAAKAASIGLIHQLARELAPSGIRVNGVSPGLTATGMTKTWDANILERAVKTIPLGRIGDPKDPAHAALFLLSPAAGYITGEIIQVNGGFYFD